MRILIIGRDHGGKMSPFVAEQTAALQKVGITAKTYLITGKGVSGYLRNIRGIRREMSVFRPDIIHAHYGLSGLAANLQRQVPVITTYHGSDVHRGGWLLQLSKIVMRWSAYNIFVSKKLLSQSGYVRANACVLPCGIDLKTIKEQSRESACILLGILKPMVLFSGSFNDQVKNPELAKAAMKKVPEAELVELKGYTRQEVNLLMNAANCLLMTSDREGSPQVVKEAMACGTPIVSVDVGDVKETIGNTEGCYIAERHADDLAEKIRQALAFNGKTNGRQRIIDLGLSNEHVAKRLTEIYEDVRRHEMENTPITTSRKRHTSV